MASRGLPWPPAGGLLRAPGDLCYCSPAVASRGLPWPPVSSRGLPAVDSYAPPVTSATVAPGWPPVASRGLPWAPVASRGLPRPPGGGLLRAPGDLCYCSPGVASRGLPWPPVGSRGLPWPPGGGLLRAPGDLCYCSHGVASRGLPWPPVSSRGLPAVDSTHPVCAKSLLLPRTLSAQAQCPRDSTRWLVASSCRQRREATRSNGTTCDSATSGVTPPAQTALLATLQATRAT